MRQDRPEAERRRAVRLRPMPDLPARARLIDDSPVDLQVWDVSVGGLAVTGGNALAALTPGTRHRVSLDLGRYGAFELDLEVRHRGGEHTDVIGMQLIDPPPAATTALGRYVAELLERGAVS
jgi:hypothetical protein